MQQQQQAGVSRRTVLKTTAWAVPAIAVAGTVPLAAASGPIVIGDFWESSANINHQSVGLSGIFVECVDATNQADWQGKTFTATVVISYTGDNENFSLDPLVNNGVGWAVASSSRTQIVLTAKEVANGCADGSFQFPTVHLTFNSAGEQPGENSIRVTGSAIAEDGSFAVGELLDATPNSPTFGSTPVGPRDTSK